MSEEQRAVIEAQIEDFIAEENEIMDREQRGEYTYQKADRMLADIEKKIVELEIKLYS